ncbi:MAG: T9SS type A sorting domain-containing protein [Ignavibacteriales bacterium]|nr:T9SS type A sorting domain-containing protein [Ignavibacteriales bacterium]
MKGKLWNGDPYLDPNTGNETIFPLAGDPVNGTGWYEGVGWPGGPIPGDRRSMISSGPFTMEPADTQEVVIAILMKRGINNINSITKLKNYASTIHKCYYNLFTTDIAGEKEILPIEYSLSQNYPNPFNPSTKLSYSITQPSIVSLKVYDVLGTEIETLVNEEKPVGVHELTWNAANLPSGVYFYRFQAGDFVQTKKMILLK